MMEIIQTSNGILVRCDSLDEAKNLHALMSAVNDRFGLPLWMNESAGPFKQIPAALPEHFGFWIQRDVNMDLPISRLEPSVRLENCLLAKGIDTVGKLADMTENQALALRNMGRCTLQEAKDKLAKFGLRFKGE